MPQYQDNPFRIVPQLISGQVEYLYGAYNFKQAPTKMQVASVALATNVATVTGQIVEGNVPTVGSLISVTQTASSAGLFNVNRAVVTGVAINNSGYGTITYALTGANLGTTVDAGTAVVDVPEIAEAIVAGASIAAAYPRDAVLVPAARTITAICNFPTLPTAVTVSLQIALLNQDKQFATVGVVSTVAGSAVTQQSGEFTLQNAAYVRLLISGLTGSGTIVGKVVA